MISGRICTKNRKSLMCSRDIARLRDGARVTTAGLVIRRQRPHGKTVFMTLEDEFGLIPLMVFPKTYEQYEYDFKSPFIMIKGRVSKREGTQNVVVTGVRPFRAVEKAPKSKNWQ